ncbi:MAG: threonine/serine ThrE exporter family protein [Cellulosilyticaceae bacterium]
MNKQFTHEDTLAFAVNVGEIMLKSGAETYRVEDTMVRMLATHHYEKIDAFVTPTGIMVSIQGQDVPLTSVVSRTKNRSTRLDKIERINQLSRDYVAGTITFQEAKSLLRDIDTTPSYSKWTYVWATGFSSAFFSLMFQGKLVDFFICLGIGVCVALLQQKLKQKEIVNYFILFLSALFIGLVVVLSSHLLPNYVNTEAMVIGGIMPLVPGVAFTNAVRDTIGDELLSGISRGIEALFIAISIAAGIGVSMSVGLFLGGRL